MRDPSTSAPRFSVRLCALALRRALAPGTLVWAALLAAILATNDWSSDAIALDAGGGAPSDAVRGGLARQGLWAGFCLALMPMLVIRAAGTIGRWRSKGEVDWLGARAATRLSIAGSTVCGTLLGAWGLVFAWWALVAATGTGAAAALQLAGTIPAPGSSWVDGMHARAWTARVPDVAQGVGTRVRIELGLGAGAGPAAEVVLRASRATRDGATAVASTRIGTRGMIEVELPSSGGEVELELSVSDPEARVLVLSESAEVWIPVASASAADRAIALRLCVASCAWLALAFGFGAWISTPSAALGVIALWIAAWLADTPCAWIPGVDLPETLGIASQGRVPAALDPRAYIGALVALVAGIALAAAGLRHWRRET
jgi:hypothetical protein